ncbi:hypothetical protein [Nostoc sp. DSM 114167]|jgi:hypothetical protein|uniref:hypothetical protein n=1 Tax=Nostoc sp. DSM 114167 TaxID=3439050 RepID=UPI004045790B
MPNQQCSKLDELVSAQINYRSFYRAGYGMHERGTHQGWIRSGSLYVKAQKHPVTTTIIVAGLGTSIW